MLIHAIGDYQKMSIKSFIYAWRPEFAIASEFYGACRDFRKAGFKKTPYGFTMAGSPAMQDGSYEADEAKSFIHYLNKVDIFIDIGANVGYFSCIARFMNKKVIAVEPLWHNLQYIYNNIHINNWSDVEVYPIGLSDKPGLAVLYGVGTAASFIKNWAGTSTKKRMVPLSTLDILLAKRFSGRKLVIKIDVEGTEYRVLKGATETMNMLPAPIWIVEIGLTEHFPDGHNADFIKVFEKFWSNGYEAYNINIDTNEKITEQRITAWINNMNTEGHYNFLFKKEII
jgi:FkbM family methyltransferase